MSRAKDVTVAIPSIPPRGATLLPRALKSVGAQWWQPGAVSIAVDTEREGAPATRQRALDVVRTPWVAFLDDDDEFLPCHLKELVTRADETDADYCYSWFWIGVGDKLMEDYVFPVGHFAVPFDNAHPRETTITVLVRTELIREVGFARRTDRAANTGEDWSMAEGCARLGAKIVNLGKKTWVWHHDSNNTSGLPDRW